MNRNLTVASVDPNAGIAGGEVIVHLLGVSAEMLPSLGVNFGGGDAHLVSVTTAKALALIPDVAADQPVEVTLQTAHSRSSDGEPDFTIGKRLARNLHPVANPTFNPVDGSLFVTRSGTRGEHVPTSIFRIESGGVLEEFSGDITNPTAIAFDRTGRMFVTSRFDGTVYRLMPDREVVAFASDLGIATGLAFNGDGDMFVGDRSGTIYRINEIGQAKPWAEHEPSVSAYHLAIGPDDSLFVAGPTVSSFESITRFDAEGKPSVFFRGLGRPQGLAFDRDGNLYVAAALRGRRGIVRISPDGKSARLVVAGMNIVGLAFGPAGQLVVATNEAVYSLPLGIKGLLS